MSLENLVQIGQLHPHEPTAAEIQRLLIAINQNLADAGVAAVSDQARFNLAYEAAMQCALVALLAKGYRPSTSKSGHHQTIIQCLELTLDVPGTEWRVLDTFRRIRNANNYSGDIVPAESIERCTELARRLQSRLVAHLHDQHPKLMAGSK